MKMHRLIAMTLCLLVFLFLMTSCSGFNSIMRNHLSNEANYTSCRGEICDIYYFDADNTKVSLLSTDEIPECDVVFKLKFDDRDIVHKFLGCEPNPERPLDEFQFTFDVTKENNHILVENGFYDTVAVNTQIEITASSFIYMDANFFFIAAVTCNETEYLHFEEGIENIRAYINKHKSLL